MRMQSYFASQLHEKLSKINEEKLCLLATVNKLTSDLDKLHRINEEAALRLEALAQAQQQHRIREVSRSRMSQSRSRSRRSRSRSRSRDHVRQGTHMVSSRIRSHEGDQEHGGSHRDREHGGSHRDREHGGSLRGREHGGSLRGREHGGSHSRDREHGGSHRYRSKDDMWHRQLPDPHRDRSKNDMWHRQLPDPPRDRSKNNMWHRQLPDPPKDRSKNDSLAHMPSALTGDIHAPCPEPAQPMDEAGLQKAFWGKINHLSTNVYKVPLNVLMNTMTEAVRFFYC